MSALQAVLDRIDQDLDQSVDRLFTLLRIASISTDPAYKKDCQKAAEHVAGDLRSIGFETEVRPTAGHPVVVGKASGASTGKGPRVLFYGHYDVQPVDPLELWKTPPFEPRIEELPGGRKIIVARGACDDKGQAMTFIEACRAFKAVTGKELKYRNPAKLVAAMSSANKARKLVRVLPSEKRVVRWIDDAKKLPPKISY